MKCELSREKLIGFVYEDLPSDEKGEVEAHLTMCAACREEVQQLTQTTRLLRAAPEEVPELNLRFVAETRRQRSWLGKVVSRPVGITFAAGSVAALFLLALFNFEASYTDGNLRVKLSLFPQQSESLTTAATDSVELVTRPAFDAWKEAHATSVQEMLAELETRQHRENRLVLTELLQEIERQRQQDLRVVGRGLEAVQLSNENRFRRTSAVLNQLLMQASYTGGTRDSSRNQ